MRYGLDRYLNVACAYGAVWLADGSGLAYLTNITGVPQVWRVGADGGSPEQLTYFSNRIGSVYATEHVPGVVFSMDAGGNEKYQLYLLKLDGSAPVNLTNDARSVHQFGGMAGQDTRMVFASNARENASFDIRTMDLRDGQQLIVLANDDGYNTPAALSPDGRYLLYNKLKGQSDNALWLLDLTDGTTRQVPPGAGCGASIQPAWLSDSRGFYFLTDAGSEFVYLARYDLGAEAIAVVWREAWDVESLALSRDDRYLAFAVNVDGYSVLRVLDTATSKSIEFPDLPHGVISHRTVLSWSPFGHQLAFTLTSAGRTPDIWVLDLESSKSKQVTFSSRCGIREDGFVEPQQMRFGSFDGLPVPAWLFTPVGSRGPLPVVIFIHGGPESQERPIFDPVLQYLTNQGLAVAAPNVRGSTGYGKRYHHLDDVEKRMDSVADIHSLVGHLIQQGIADPRRIAVTGGSYGGFMTLASITEYPELWAAAVDVVGIANFETFMENTSAYRRAHRASEYGSLEQHRDVLRRISPIHKVDRIQCPLMVIHGANDPRVPVSEAEQIVESLRQRGCEVEYLRYEDEGHGIVRLANRRHCFEQVAHFLRKHLLEGSGS